MFSGSLVALITPLTPSGSLDLEALKNLVQWHIESGTHGLVPVGTTGEASTLSKDEHRHVLKLIVDEVDNKIPVIAGCGSNNTAEAIELHAYAHSIGASAALHVTGYYNRPSQEGIFRHFEALNSANDLPIVVYNVPARAVVNISATTMGRISELDSVVGVKDATNDLTRPYLERMAINVPFCQLSGEDATTVAYNVSGGVGCISVTANVTPALCAAMQSACLNKDFESAMEIQELLSPLHEALFLEPSPAGVKYACSTLQLCDDHVRLPLVGINPQTKSKIDAALQQICKSDLVVK
jgi:4-hydroxy-tetrahydrodipicolinate synthase